MGLPGGEEEGGGDLMVSNKRDGTAGVPVFQSMGCSYNFGTSLMQISSREMARG